MSTQTSRVVGALVGLLVAVTATAPVAAANHGSAPFASAVEAFATADPSTSATGDPSMNATSEPDSGPTSYCGVEPGPVSPDAGWPSRRYDLAALSRVTTGAGTVVAVLDSGVDRSHPQLQGGAVVAARELTPQTTGGDLIDCVGHGTAVASIIAARPVDGSGLRGLAPGATILAARVSDRVQTDSGYVGEGDVADLVAGIDAALAYQPRPAVLNLSLSTAVDRPELRDAIRRALAADVVVVAAVGNLHGQGNPTPYPAAYEGVVGVGAIDEAGLRLEASQVGPYVDLVAPGVDVLAATRRGGHGLFTGTSFAVPYVAATAALIRARWPHLSATQVVHRLLATADPPAGAAPSPEYGYGVLNPLRAVTDVVPPTPAATATTMPVPVVGPANSAAEPAALPMGLLAAAGGLLFAAALVTAVAVATPFGRRRRWRPGGSPTPD